MKNRREIYCFVSFLKDVVEEIEDCERLNDEKEKEVIGEVERILESFKNGDYESEE